MQICNWPTVSYTVKHHVYCATHWRKILDPPGPPSKHNSGWKWALAICLLLALAVFLTYLFREKAREVLLEVVHRLRHRWAAMNNNNNNAGGRIEDVDGEVGEPLMARCRRLAANAFDTIRPRLQEAWTSMGNAVTVVYNACCRRRPRASDYDLEASDPHGLEDNSGNPFLQASPRHARSRLCLHSDDEEERERMEMFPKVTTRADVHPQPGRRVGASTFYTVELG